MCAAPTRLYLPKPILHNRPYPNPPLTDLDDQAAREGGQPGKQEEGDKEGGEGKEGAAEAGEQSEEARAAAASAAAAAAQAEDPSFFLRRDGEPALEYAARVFGRVYTTDIQRLAEVKVGAVGCVCVECVCGGGWRFGGG